MVVILHEDNRLCPLVVEELYQLLIPVYVSSGSISTQRIKEATLESNAFVSVRD